jgi:eukaryotic-like serine/threonine-protein kinase
MHNATAATAGRLVSGRYRLREPIGRGAMGIVWRGRDELLAREVAVKEVRAAADNDGIYQRTLREAKAAARLNHPGVVTVFDVVEVHRDVKPGNVLVAADNAVKLTDFGIATYPGDPTLTQVGIVFGTPGYTAPERVRGEAATPASDLWSLGATLYTAVEGRGPFDRPGGSAAIFAGVASEPAPRAPSAGPLGPVIDALLRPDPARRPDVAAAARLLDDAAAHADSVSAFSGGFTVPGGYQAFPDVREFPPMPPAAPAAPAAEPAQPRSRAPGRVLAAAALAVAMAAAAFIGYALYPRSPSTADDPDPVTAVHGSVTGGQAAHGTASTGTGSRNTASSGSGDDPAAGSSSADSGGGTPSAGYQWLRVTAASIGTAAGFKVAVPASWQLATHGLVSYLRPPSGRAYIEISLEPFTYPGPLREAAYLQAQALRQDLYPGYRLVAIRPGTLLGQPDAAWRFSWLQGGTKRVDVLQWVVSVPTSAGTQGYELAASAPSPAFGWALTVFRRAMLTFQPLT